MPPRLAVCADPPQDPNLHQAAAQQARELGLPLLDDPAIPRDAQVLLAVTPHRLELRVVAGDPLMTQGRPVATDLRRVDTTSPLGKSLRQPLLRAIGLRKGDPARPRVVDATAGYGEDAWLLAAMGCPVLAIERHALIAAMLRDAVRRAAHDQPQAAARLTVITADSTALLRQLAQPDAPLPPELAAFRQPPVVYLDPMFPPGRKTAQRKPMRLLHWLIGEDADAADLLDAALAAAQRRVVVKRPRHAPPLAGRSPTATHQGHSVRYDVYATA